MTTADSSSKPTTNFQISDQENEKYFLRTEWEPLVISAFPNIDKIDLRKRFSGYSVAQTWWVVTKKEKESGLYVIKIASKDKIDDEWDRIDKYVTGAKLYGNPVKPEKKIDSPDGRWSLLVFSFAGYEITKTLLAYYREHDNLHTEQILGNIFVNRADRNIGPYPSYYYEHYDRLLTAHFEFVGLAAERIDDTYTINGPEVAGKLKQLNEDLSKESKPIRLESFRVVKNEKGVLTLRPDQPAEDDSFTIRVKYKLTDQQQQDASKINFPIFAHHPKTRNEILTETANDVMSRDLRAETFKFGPPKNVYTYPNPVKHLYNLLNREDWLRQGTIHGDLNLQNILLSFPKAASKNQMGTIPKDSLIDFADTRYGPILLDFQWLEVNVILWILAPTLKKDTKKNLIIVTDLWKMLHRDETELPSNLETLNKPYTLLRLIRAHARHYLYNDWKEYYRGLVIALLGSLRFHKSIPVDDYALRVAFLYAAQTLCWSDILSPEELKKISPELLTLDPLPTDPIRPSTPIIDPLSKDHILRGEVLNLTGRARPGATLGVFVNGNHITDITANESGHWQTELPFAQAGAYELFVRDPKTKVASAPLRLTVAKQKGVPRSLLVAASLCALVAATGIWFYNENGNTVFSPTPTASAQTPLVIAESPILTSTLISIGIVVDTKGEDPAVGNEQRQAAEVAEQFFNQQNVTDGFQLKLVPVDTDDSSLQASQAFTELIVQERVAAIIGPTYSSQAAEAALVAERHRVPVIGASTTADDVPKYGCFMSRIAAPAAQIQPLTLVAAYQLNPVRQNVALAYLSEENSYTLSEAAAFTKTIQNDSRFNLLLPVEIFPSDPSESKLAAIADRMISNQPNLVVISAEPKDGGMLIRQLHQKGYTGLIIGGDGFNSQGVFKPEVCGQDCNGVIVGQAYNKDADNPRNREFVQAYREKYKREPFVYSAQMFTAVQMIVDVLKELDKQKPPIRDLALPQLRTRLNEQLLSGTMKFDTPLGEISLAPNGEVQQRKIYVARIESYSWFWKTWYRIFPGNQSNGQYKVIDPRGYDGLFLPSPPSDCD